MTAAELPEELAGFPAVVEWWQALTVDPRSASFTELDWLDARDTAMVVADFYENLNLDRAGELRTRKDRLEARLQVVSGVGQVDSGSGKRRLKII